MFDSERTTASAAHNYKQRHLMNFQSSEDQIQIYQPGRMSCDSHVSYDDIRDYGNRVRKSAENYARFRQSWSGPLIDIDHQPRDDDDGGGGDEGDEEPAEFGFSTPPPPVWGPSASLPPSHHRKNYRNMSPASKAQAIARGQRELMEMVSKMPESCYELSLKDLVERQPVVEVKQEQQQVEEHEEVNSKKKKKNDKIKKMEIVKKRNGSVSDNKNKEGFLLKMVFPLAFGTKSNKKNKNKKNKKKSEMGAYSFKVAPRPPVVEGSDHRAAVDDKEWWKKRFEQSESDRSSGSSSNHGSGKSSLSSISSSSLSRNSSRYRHIHVYNFFLDFAHQLPIISDIFRFGVLNNNLPVNC